VSARLALHARSAVRSRLAERAASAGTTASRPVRVVVVLLLVLTGVLGAATTANADDQGARQITRYDATFVLASDGSARVTLDFDFDFADTPGHGPFITLPIRQAIQGDEENVRAYPVSGVVASSPSGAPADVYLTETPYWLEIRVGNEDIGDVSGVQRYVVQYTVDGVVNPGAGANGEDEFYWNVIGTDWVIPLSNLSASVIRPAGVLDTVCYAVVVGGTTPCTSDTFSGTTAAFTQGSLAPGEPFTVAVAYPGGTFVDAEPIIVEAPRPPNPFAVTTFTGGLASLVLLGGGAFVVVRARKKGRDQAYLGLTPGLSPVHAKTSPSDRRRPHPSPSSSRPRPACAQVR